jgi:hypothetical protein
MIGRGTLLGQQRSKIIYILAGTKLLIIIINNQTIYIKRSAAAKQNVEICQFKFLN